MGKSIYSKETIEKIKLSLDSTERTIESVKEDITSGVNDDGLLNNLHETKNRLEELLKKETSK